VLIAAKNKQLRLTPSVEDVKKYSGREKPVLKGQLHVRFESKKRLIIIVTTTVVLSPQNNIRDLTLLCEIH
jgi:hypothetical protein